MRNLPINNLLDLFVYLEELFLLLRRREPIDRFCRVVDCLEIRNFSIIDRVCAHGNPEYLHAVGFCRLQQLGQFLLADEIRSEKVLSDQEHRRFGGGAR